MMYLTIDIMRIFFQFLLRDLRIYAQEFKDDAINFVVIYPTINAISFGYLQSNIFFRTHDPQRATLYFSGVILFIVLLIAYQKMVGLIFDLEHDQYVHYQLILLPAPLLLLERIIAVSLLCTVLSIPFIFVGKLLLGSYLDLSGMNSVLLVLSLIIASLLSASYTLFAMCLLDTTQLRTFWARINSPLMILGGFWAPWYIMNQYSYIIGILTLANPFLYISEAIRGSLFAHNSHFIRLPYCIGMMLLFTCLFTIGSMYVFKKRVDYI